MPRNRRSLACTVVPLDARLGNSEVGVLLDAPLLEGGHVEDLVLTSDQWVSLLAQRTRSGRPLHFVEVA